MLSKLRNAMFVVLVSALAIRLAWEIVRPVLPLLVVLAGLLFIFSLMFKRSQ